jgi:hypothetical protein
MTTRRAAVLAMALVAGSGAMRPAAAQGLGTMPDVVQSGDMLLFRDALLHGPPRDGDRAHERGASGFDVYVGNPWPGGVVPVTFDTDVTEPRRRTFMDGCAVWTPLTGLRCVERTDERSWLLVTQRGPNCSATVGAPLFGNGIFNFGESWCWETVPVIHDIGHVFGLIHEHQRADRDTYVEVHPENAQSGFAYAFDLLASGRNLSEYDFDSIMHYHGHAYSGNGQPTIRPRAGYADRARNMGFAVLPSRLDVDALVQLYNATPREPGRSPGPTRFDRGEFLNAMRDLDRVYMVDLQRSNGLSIGGRPDFLGIAAWIFDVYLSSRASGYTEGESFYNVRASISQVDEWRQRNPHLTPMRTLPMFSTRQLDRGEYLAAMARLDEAYRTELLRPDGLSLGGRPDLLGIAAWIFDVYLNERLRGEHPEKAWELVLRAIRDSDEYRRKH